MGLMRIMGPEKGDEPLKWNPEDEKETEKAREQFEEYTKPQSEGGKGFNAYRVEVKSQRKGKPVKEFDPQEGEYMLVPQMSGG